MSYFERGDANMPVLSFTIQSKRWFSNDRFYFTLRIPASVVSRTGWELADKHYGSVRLRSVRIRIEFRAGSGGMALQESSENNQKRDITHVTACAESETPAPKQAKRVSWSPDTADNLIKWDVREAIHFHLGTSFR